MLHALKKLFTKKPSISEEVSHNYELVNRLTNLVHYPNVEQLFFSPSGKLYLLNMYTKNFHDLLNNLLSTNLSRTYVAVNIHAYFHSSTSTLQNSLSRILPLLSTNKLSSTIEHDLFQICTAFEDLVQMENRHV